MASFSFDIVSEIDKAEMNNVFMQAEKEIQGRYDFKETSAGIDWLDDKKGLKLTGDNEWQVDAVLDILEQTGAAQACIPIIHWFSGSSDELQRAIKLGCWFSVGEMSLKTKRGREYAKVYPKDKLLTETDLPSSDHTDIDALDIVDSLKRALLGLSEARGYSVQSEVMANAAGVFGV